MKEIAVQAADAIIGQLRDLKLDAVVVAVSGGADSTALLELACEAASLGGFTLAVCHVHHGIRGAEADRDAAFVRELAEQRLLPFHLSEVDALAERTRTGESLEAVARRLRYEALEAQANRYGRSLILLGHHRDDQVETVLDHVLRGAGVSGLRGMDALRPQGSHYVYRPLLDRTRMELRAFLRSRGIGHVEDSSNELVDIRRNRIRRELLPYLRERFNPRIDDALMRLRSIAAAEDAWVREIASAAFRDCVQLSNGRATFERGRFRALPCALQRRIVKLVSEYLVEDSFFELADVEFVRRLAIGDFRGSQRVGSSFLAVGTADEFHFQKIGLDARRIDAWAAVKIGGFAFFSLAGGLWQVRADTVPPPERFLPSPWEAWFSRQDGEEFVLRPWQRGDRMRPLGLGGSRLISDVFIDAKVPRGERCAYPILAAGEEILWVPGLCRAESHLVRGDEPLVQHVQIERELA